MEQEVRKLAADLLSGGNVIGILGLRSRHGQVGPHFFTKAEELESMVLSPVHIHAKTVASFAPRKERIGVVVRGCDERSLLELAKLNQVDMSRIDTIGFTCSREQAEECGCAIPYPSKISVGEKVAGAEDQLKTKLLSMKVEDRDAFWRQQLLKCQKCYGCRNACPICVCKTCEMEQAMWVPKGALPPEIHTFHLIKVFHLADKCTGCGECVRACPVSIPLKTLQLMLIDEMDALFDYTPGVDERPSPFLTSLEECPIKGGTHD